MREHGPIVADACHYDPFVYRVVDAVGDLVDVGRLTGDDAAQAARDLVQTNPRKVFKL